MWLDPGPGNRAIRLWWLRDGGRDRLWAAGARTLAGLLRGWRRARRGVKLPPVSDEWLRQHESETGKRADDR